MITSKPRRRARYPAVWFLVLAAMAGLLLYPQQAGQAARDGLLLCYRTVIPSLFPFFALSSMAVEFGLADWLGRRTEGLMRPVFGLSGPCSAALALGLIGGYPVGARCAADLCRRGAVSREEAEHLLAFCNNCGPAFLISVAGAGVFGSTALGIVLWLVHIAAALLTGLLMRPLLSRSRRSAAPAPVSAPTAPHRPPLAAAFSETVKNAAFSTLSVCGYVVFFAVAVQLLESGGILPLLAAALGLLLQPLGIGRSLSGVLLTGLLEVTGGITALGSVPAPPDLRLCLGALLLGWGGISVHCQTMSFLSPAGLSARRYISGKTLQALLSFGLMLSITRLTDLTRSLPAFAPMQSHGLTGTACVGIAVGITALWLAALGIALRRRP